MTFYIDLDGPLLDVSEKYHRVYKTIVEDLGGRPLPKEDYWELKRQRADMAQILDRSKLSASAQTAYASSRLDIIETPKFLLYDRLQPGAVQTLARLRVKHDLFLVTLRTRATALRRELERLGLIPFFRGILSAPADSQSRHLTKVRLIKSLGEGQAREAIVVGDTETDIAAGKELGFTTVAVLDGIRARQILSDCGPDYIIETFSDLPQHVQDI
jgi:phosphoglycolate phosphatase